MWSGLWCGRQRETQLASRGWGMSLGGRGLGQGRVCQPSGIPNAPFSKPFAGLSYFFVCTGGPPTCRLSLGKCVQPGPPLVASRSGRSTADSCSLRSLQGIGCLAHHQPYSRVGFCPGGESGRHKDVLDPNALSCFLVTHHGAGVGGGGGVCPGCHPHPLYSSNISLGL